MQAISTYQTVSHALYWKRYMRQIRSGDETMCGHIPKILIQRSEAKGNVHFKFAHVLKHSVRWIAVEDSSLCKSMPMNLLSASDRLHLERDCSAGAGRKAIRAETEVRQARLDRRQA